jgi:hypothetical protein
MDRRTRTSLATSLALALAGCVGSASPSQPESFAPSTTPAPIAASSTPLPSATPSPTPIASLPFVGTIAYNRNLVDGTHGDSRLFTMPASGGDGLQLLDTEGEQARWSIDGTRLSVVGESPQGLIFVGFVNRDGTNVVRFDSPDPTLNLGCGGWSRDESTFVCEGWDEQTPGRAGLYTVAANGTHLARLTTAPEGRRDAPCDFSPDDARIAFVRINIAADNHNELRTVNRSGAFDHRLNDEVVGIRCRWSPDGSTLLVEADGGILVVAFGDPQPTPTLLPLDVPAGARLSHPTWSFDGAHVALSVALPGEMLDIWIVNADGSGATRLTNTPGIDEEVESWGP